MYDVIIDGSDNFETRYLVNDACVILGKPLVFGAIFKFSGQLSVFNFENGPTYRCLFLILPDLMHFHLAEKLAFWEYCPASLELCRHWRVSKSLPALER